jgi:hypothetical protein
MTRSFYKVPKRLGFFPSKLTSCENLLEIFRFFREPKDFGAGSAHRLAENKAIGGTDSLGLRRLSAFCRVF